jgi:hypothetical protein
MEEFRELEEYPGYKIGNRGTIINKFGKQRKNYVCQYGYARTTFFFDGISTHFKVHRLVALSWLPNPENKPCIDHINRDKLDNSVENLRWATHMENSQNLSTFSTNKSGITGLFYDKSNNHWYVSKIIHGVRHRKSFKERADAEEYLRLITGQH